MDTSQIQLHDLSKNQEIFGDIAKKIAEKINEDRIVIQQYDKNKKEYVEKVLAESDELNKSTQIRKYYDELVMWHEKVMLNGDYENNAPFIKMMKAKVAYAHGRKKIGDDFLDMFNAIINQINSAETLKNAKLFFEAVLGFRKALEKGK